MLILLSLLWCSASLQSCPTSSNQTNIAFTTYNNGNASEPYLISNSILDSSNNEYVAFQLGSDSVNSTLKIAKINPDRNIAWSKIYTNTSSATFKDSIQLSYDENTLMVIGEDPDYGSLKFFNIATGNFLSFQIHIMILCAYLLCFIKIHH